jgi:hypothetical protein
MSTSKDSVEKSLKEIQDFREKQREKNRILRELNGKWQKEKREKDPLSAKTVPRFEGSDINMLRYLKEHGYVVVKSVLSSKDVEKAKDLFWEFLSDQIDAKRGNMDSFSHFGVRFSFLLFSDICKFIHFDRSTDNRIENNGNN